LLHRRCSLTEDTERYRVLGTVICARKPRTNAEKGVYDLRSRDETRGHYNPCDTSTNKRKYSLALLSMMKENCAVQRTGTVDKIQKVQ
jgi:hypothetical protein